MPRNKENHLDIEIPKVKEVKFPNDSSDSSDNIPLLLRPPIEEELVPLEEVENANGELIEFVLSFLRDIVSIPVAKFDGKEEPNNSTAATIANNETIWNLLVEGKAVSLIKRGEPKDDR